MKAKDTNKLAEVYGGVPVLHSIPGSPSHQAGIRAGSVLLEINGVEVKDIDDYMRAKATNPERMKARFIDPEGEEHEADFALDNSDPDEAEEQLTQMAKDGKFDYLVPEEEPDPGLN